VRRKYMRRIFIISLPLILLAVSAFGLNVSVAQIDASRLLLTQNVDAYVSVTDDTGQPVQGLAKEAFGVFESSDGKDFRQIDRIVGFTANSGSTEGITFMLLIDNSGSMYDTLDGRKTTDPAQMRITHVKDAVRTFLSSMTNPRDRVGLVAFNTLYARESPPVSDRERIGGLLDSIRKPTSDEAYTELYAALNLAARDFAGIGGRKAIIVLSDGENYPFSQYSGKSHPVYGSKIYQYTEPIQACQEEGVTVYAIDFAEGKDRNIQSIAHETGGQVFDARNSRELAGVYEDIHRQVAAEYRLTYPATTAPAEKKYVRVDVSGPGGTATATRFYFASTVFGLPMSSPSILLLIPFLLAAALLWLLTLLKLERKPGPASLEVIQTQVGRPLTKTIVLGSAKTVIGGGTNANLTIVGAPQVKEQHATILFDPKDKSYTVVGSGGDLTVNNQPVKSRKLEPGDVLDVGGATIVFDETEKKGKTGKGGK
jgi:Ca-activated chloride channel family protein